MNNKTFNAEHHLMLSTRFYENAVVRSLQKEFGYKGSLLASYILSEIARNGGSVRYGYDFYKPITELFPEISRNLIKMVVRRMTDADFLDKKAYTEKNILTYPERYIAGSKIEVSNGHVDASVPYYFVINVQSGDLSEENDNNRNIIAAKTELSPRKHTEMSENAIYRC